MVSEVELQEKYESIFPVLNERQRRLIAASDAMLLGRRWVSKVSRASRLSRTTIHRGMQELAEGHELEERVREAGGGRKKITEWYPGLIKELEKLVGPTTRGDPMSPLCWSCKSTRELAQVLQRRGYEISYPTVASLLHDLGYSLQANAKTIEGKDHPDRDEQFRYINSQVKRYLKEKEPVISVDTKKKELVGEYKNNGQEWREKGKPRKVKTHDFPAKDVKKAVP